MTIRPGRLLALLLGVLLLAACGLSGPAPIASGPAAAGQRIFNAGVGPDGQPIPRSGGFSMPMMGGEATCASCHGADGHGERTMMLTTPDITYRNLTDPAGMIETDGSHGMVYTDALIRRAVVQGIGADGGTLSSAMPRWQLTDAAWQDLLAYLKTLR
jgi:mono/diheme cytochrome c family protein